MMTNTRQKMRHLQASISGPGTLCKDFDDEAHSVNHMTTPDALQIPLLYPAEFSIYHHPVQKAILHTTKDKCCPGIAGRRNTLQKM